MPNFNQFNPYQRQMQRGLMPQQQEQDPWQSIANIVNAFQMSTPNSQERQGTTNADTSAFPAQSPQNPQINSAQPASNAGSYDDYMGRIMQRMGATGNPDQQLSGTRPIADRIATIMSENNPLPQDKFDPNRKMYSDQEQMDWQAQQDQPAQRIASAVLEDTPMAPPQIEAPIQQTPEQATFPTANPINSGNSGMDPEAMSQGMGVSQRTPGGVQHEDVINNMPDQVRQLWEAAQQPNASYTLKQKAQNDYNNLLRQLQGRQKQGLSFGYGSGR